MYNNGGLKNQIYKRSYDTQAPCIWRTRYDSSGTGYGEYIRINPQGFSDLKCIIYTLIYGCRKMGGKTNVVVTVKSV
jgi:uncharacterized protein involved in tellurium resistance